MVEIPFEQAPEHDGVERPQLPRAAHVRSTPLFDEFKRPVVRCRLVIREARDVRIEGDGPCMVFDVDCQADDQLVRLADGFVEVDVRHLDVAVEISDEIVGYERLRRWRILGAESISPWE